MLSSVSIILPAYNGDRFIADAITSVLQQSYSAWELIIIDDGSTDATREMIQPFCQQYPDKIYYYYQSNQGVGAARNHGLQVARGEAIAFLDQDDCFLPKKLALQTDLLDHNPQIGIINSGWQITNEQGEAIAIVQPWQGMPNLDLASWLEWKPVFLGAMLFRRAWLTTLFDPQLQQTGDVEFVLKLALLGCPATWLKQLTVSYRQHSQNVSLNGIEQSQELQLVLDRIFRNAATSDQIRQLEPASRYQSLVWSAWRLYGQGHFAEMAEHLAQSIQYRSATRTEIILNWIEQWLVYAKEYGKELDVLALTQLKEWQGLIQQVLR